MMSDLQIFGLCSCLFLFGGVFFLFLVMLLENVLKFIQERKIILDYLKYHNRYVLPYMLVYKYLSKEEKEHILKIWRK